MSRKVLPSPTGAINPAPFHASFVAQTCTRSIYRHPDTDPRSQLLSATSPLLQIGAKRVVADMNLDAAGRDLAPKTDYVVGVRTSEATGPDQISAYHHIILPATCKQIDMLARSEDNEHTFICHGVEVSDVRMVGRMVERVDSESEIRFAIHDGTGRVDARFWFNHVDEHTHDMHQARNGDYVIVNGGLRTSGSLKLIEAFTVRRVINFNDIYHHFLQCIYAHLDLRKRAKATSIARVVAEREPYTASQQSSLSVKDNGLSLFDNVIRVFSVPGVRSLEYGPSVSLLSDMTGAFESEIRSVIDVHITRGDMFATIDDQHFKASYNG